MSYAIGQKNQGGYGRSLIPFNNNFLVTLKNVSMGGGLGGCDDKKKGHIGCEKFGMDR